MADPRKPPYEPVDDYYRESRPAYDDTDSGRFHYSSGAIGASHFDDSQFDSSRTFGESLIGSGALHSGGRPTEMKLMAMAPEPGLPAERPRDYKGRYRVSSPEE